MNIRKGIGGHQRAYQGKTDEWLTPPNIIKTLGTFDLDPCSPINRPWDTALNHYTINDNGLLKEWKDSVWLNPPYGPQTKQWLEKMANHNNGIALIFARTETKMFHDYVWNVASGIFFFKGRLFFHNVMGHKANNNAGGPSCLISYNQNNFKRLQSINDIYEGKLIQL